LELAILGLCLATAFPLLAQKKEDERLAGFNTTDATHALMIHKLPPFIYFVRFWAYNPLAQWKGWNDEDRDRDPRSLFSNSIPPSCSEKRR
jgi:hypothetical protein